MTSILLGDTDLIHTSKQQTMNKIEHPSMVTLINNTLERIPETSSGTYNAADPTAFSKGSIETTFKGMPVELIYNDCTWGNELRIYLRRQLIGAFYLSWDRVHNGKHWVNQESVIPRQKTKGLLKLLFLLNKELEPCIPDNEYWDDDPMGHPSMYI